jgi:hypothetical protein
MLIIWTLQRKKKYPPGRWFSPGTSVSSANKTDRHDITEILLKVALNTISLPLVNYLDFTEKKII